MKTDLRILKTKEALRTALLSLLKEKTLTAISVTELCRLARVNRGTFYTHYGQVEDLFEAYFRDIMKDLSDSYQEPYRYAPVLDPEMLDPSTVRIFHHIKAYESFYRIVFSDSVPMSYYYLLFDHIQELILRDMDLRRDVSVDPAMLSAYQANAILGLIIEWHRQDFEKSAEEMNGLLVKILKI